MTMCDPYRFTFICCGDPYDIRWNDKCKKCGRPLNEKYMRAAKLAVIFDPEFFAPLEGDEDE